MKTRLSRGQGREQSEDRGVVAGPLQTAIARAEDADSFDGPERAEGREQQTDPVLEQVLRDHRQRSTRGGSDGKHDDDRARCADDCDRDVVGVHAECDDDEDDLHAFQENALERHQEREHVEASRLGCGSARSGNLLAVDVVVGVDRACGPRSAGWPCAAIAGRRREVVRRWRVAARISGSQVVRV